MGNSRGKQFICLKLPSVLSSVMKSHDNLLPLGCDMNHLFVQHIPPISQLVSHLGFQINHLAVAVLVFKLTLILLNYGLKFKSSDAGNLGTSKRSHKVPPPSK